MRKTTDAILTLFGLFALLYFATGLGISLLTAVVLIIVPYLYGLYDGVVVLD